MSRCPSCNTDAAKPRVGTLGEQTGGMWCTQCGHVWEPVVIHYPASAVRSVQWPASSSDGGSAPTLSGDALDLFMCDVFGLIRDVLPSGRLETDDEFRARALAKIRHIGAAPIPPWVPPGPATWPYLIKDPGDRDYIRNATANQLDRAGTSIGHPRQPGETDEQYRARLLS